MTVKIVVPTHSGAVYLSPRGMAVLLREKVQNEGFTIIEGKSHSYFSVVDQANVAEFKPTTRALIFKRFDSGWKPKKRGVLYRRYAA